MEENKKVVETEVIEKESKACKEDSFVKKIVGKFKKGKDNEVKVEKQEGSKTKKILAVAGGVIGVGALIGAAYILGKNGCSEKLAEALEDSTVSDEALSEMVEQVVNEE